MRAGNFILSDIFIMNSPKGLVNLGELTFLYELKTAILETVEIYGFHLGNIKEMHEDLHCVEESIQEAFGYPMNRDYHRFWEWPYCKCPRLDNEDNWGTKFHYYSGSCPVHGEKGNHAEPDKITQENWKEHFFTAVKESVDHAKATKKMGKIEAWKAVLEGKKVRVTIWEPNLYVFLRGSQIVIAPDLSDFNFNNQYYEAEWEIMTNEGSIPVEESVNHVGLSELEKIEIRKHFAKNFVELIEHTQGHNMLYPVIKYLLNDITPEQIRKIYTKVVQALDEHNV